MDQLIGKIGLILALILLSAGLTKKGPMPMFRVTTKRRLMGRALFTWW